MEFKMSSKENEIPIERVRCIYCGNFFRTDEYDEICYHCELKKENGEKLVEKFEPDIIRVGNIEPNSEHKIQKKITIEHINETYGKYEPLKDIPTSLKHEIVDLDYSHYFIGKYIPKDRNPDLLSKKIYPRFKSVFKLLYEPEAQEFASYLIEGIKKNEIQFDIIVPVPSSSGMVKKSQRLLTRILSRELNIENGVNVVKRDSRIRKSKFSGLDRPTIQEHLNSLSCSDKVSGKRVLLFDDIYTSGNTIRACIRLLKEKKAKDVTVITLAKTIGW